jgi:hypothetical protein
VGGFDEEGEILIHSTAIVRETAYRKITQDLETREELNQMAAADHQRELDQKAEAIARAVESGNVRDVLLGKRPLIECSHERIHEGLCLNCGIEWGVCDEAICRRPVYPNFDSTFCKEHQEYDQEDA